MYIQYMYVFIYTIYSIYVKALKISYDIHVYKSIQTKFLSIVRDIEGIFTPIPLYYFFFLDLH